MNTKAQIGDTLTWIVATIIIFFIMVIYLAGVAGIVKRVEISSGEISFATQDKAVSLTSFLNSKIDGESVYELVSKAEADNKQKADKFKEAGKKFLDENYPIDSFAPKLKYWLRLYEINEPISKYPDKNPETIVRELFTYDDYQIFGGVSSMLDSSNCDPEKGVISYIWIYPDKKIVLCVEQIV